MKIKVKRQLIHGGSKFVYIHVGNKIKREQAMRDWGDGRITHANMERIVSRLPLFIKNWRVHKFPENYEIINKGEKHDNRF